MTIEFDDSGWGQCMKEGHTGVGIYTVHCPECEAAASNPVTLIEAEIDRLMIALPTLPAWAAHQICGWSWAAHDLYESAEAYIEHARAESEAAHAQGAHQ